MVHDAYTSLTAGLYGGSLGAAAGRSAVGLRCCCSSPLRCSVAAASSSSALRLCCLCCARFSLSAAFSSVERSGRMPRAPITNRLAAALSRRGRRGEADVRGASTSACSAEVEGEKEEDERGGERGEEDSAGRGAGGAGGGAERVAEAGAVSEAGVRRSRCKSPRRTSSAAAGGSSLRSLGTGGGGGAGRMGEERRLMGRGFCCGGTVGATVVEGEEGKGEDWRERLLCAASTLTFCSERDTSIGGGG